MCLIRSASARRRRRHRLRRAADDDAGPASPCTGGPTRQNGFWLADSAQRRMAVLALNLVPFTGIAFLWFIGVVRDRFGNHEDRFFATVSLGSGLLFVAMLFVAAAVRSRRGLLEEAPMRRPGSDGASARSCCVCDADGGGVHHLDRDDRPPAAGIMPRWLGVTGYAVAADAAPRRRRVTRWNELLFPLWILPRIDTLVTCVRRGERTHIDPTAR